MILCVSCKLVKDYGNGWVWCPPRGVWLKKGYKNCASHEEGEPENVQHPNTWSWIDRVKESIKPNVSRSKEEGR